MTPGKAGELSFVSSSKGSVKAQIDKMVQRFGVKQVPLVGDRWMIRTVQISDLKEAGFHYLTAITKPQIQALLKTEVLQLSIFDEDLIEVTTEEVRFVVAPVVP
jgi:hypothetical protein